METKHEFVDDYPYLVYAADNKAVYTASGDTPYIPGGSEGGMEVHKIGTVTLATDTGALFLVGAIFDNGDTGWNVISNTATDNDPQTFDVYCTKDQYDEWGEDTTIAVFIFDSNAGTPVTTVGKVTCTGDIEPIGETPNYLWTISGNGTITYAN